MALATAFGALLTLSVFPLLAFFVIGLGKLLGGMYWLSALIVAAACAVVGGAMTAAAYVKLRNLGLDFPHARHGLEQEREAVVEKVEELRNATQRRAA
jgi:hypothetical protein